MLKKLVKYGNSNAIILDKAILELLEIEEGSIIKIKTDGKSIIITPQEKAVSAQVHETFTHGQANIQASVKEGFKGYKGINADQQEQLGNEFQALLEEHQSLGMQLSQNSEFHKAIAQLGKKVDTSSPEYFAAIAGLKNKFAPELVAVEEVLKSFGTKYKLYGAVSPKQQSALEQEFAAAHKRNHAIYKAHGELLNNPEYQHEAQLIAEKYGADKNSADYLGAMDALNDRYHPEFRKAQEELKAIAERFASMAAAK